MKKISIILGFSLISILAFPQWKWQNPLPAGNPLYAVFFTDAAHGYAAGEAGTILKTTDGGSTWTVHSGGQDVTGISMFFTKSANQNRWHGEKCRRLIKVVYDSKFFKNAHP